LPDRAPVTSNRALEHRVSHSVSTLHDIAKLQIAIRLHLGELGGGLNQIAQRDVDRQPLSGAQHVQDHIPTDGSLPASVGGNPEAKAGSPPACG
jgi:hypothetical protein